MVDPGHDTRDYPPQLLARLGHGAPEELFLLGRRGLLGERKTALFLPESLPAPERRLALDTIRRLRDRDRAVIGGFETALERESLAILLQGRQPVIICPARAIESLRIPADCRAPFDAGRLLYLSPFIQRPLRPTRETAFRRGLLVAALADEALVAHAESGGQTALIRERLLEWKVPLL